MKNRIKCSKCGFKIRGKKHEEGGHHKNGIDKKYCPVQRKRRY